jgi:hypothetical protein
MQLCWLAVVVALVPALSSAQTRDSAARRDPPPHFSITPLYDHPNRASPAHVGVPLPRIGLPLPPIGLRPPAQQQHRSRHHRGRSFAPWPVMYVMVEPYPSVVAQQAVQPAPAVTQPSFKGSLDQAIAYRHEMRQIDQPITVTTLQKTPTTFYLIPGCYMGNVPPKDAGLPATCDLSRTQTFRN